MPDPTLTIEDAARILIAAQDSETQCRSRVDQLKADLSDAERALRAAQTRVRDAEQTIIRVAAHSARALEKALAVAAP